MVQTVRHRANQMAQPSVRLVIDRTIKCGIIKSRDYMSPKKIYDNAVDELFFEPVSKRIDQIIFDYYQSDEYKKTSVKYGHEEFLFDRQNFIDAFENEVYIKNGMMWKDFNEFDRYYLDFLHNSPHCCCCKTSYDDLAEAMHNFHDTRVIRFNEIKNELFCIVTKTENMGVYLKSDSGKSYSDAFRLGVTEFLNSYFEDKNDGLLIKALQWYINTGKNPFPLHLLPAPLNNENCGFACRLCASVKDSWLYNETKDAVYKLINETVLKINESEKMIFDNIKKGEKVMDFDLSTVPTCELVGELRKREGVFDKYVEPYEPYGITVGEKTETEKGPAIILTVID